MLSVVVYPEHGNKNSAKELTNLILTGRPYDIIDVAAENYEFHKSNCNTQTIQTIMTMRILGQLRDTETGNVVILVRETALKHILEVLEHTNPHTSFTPENLQFIISASCITANWEAGIRDDALNIFVGRALQLLGHMYRNYRISVGFSRISSGTETSHREFTIEEHGPSFVGMTDTFQVVYPTEEIPSELLHRLKQSIANMQSQIEQLEEIVSSGKLGSSSDIVAQLAYLIGLNSDVAVATFSDIVDSETIEVAYTHFDDPDSIERDDFDLRKIDTVDKTFKLWDEVFEADEND